ncbi:MAG TPA: triose-phosphate isomerase [Gemmatimonadales bacterium]|nr:triose-phosphate isomerase [Gemmatimonadales bacterium]
MRPLLFAANWKMHLGPRAAREFFEAFLPRTPARPGREIWFFPPAVSLEPVARAIAPRADLAAGAQDVYWEEKGAFTGAVSAPLAAEAGARAALVGHSERRHVFGETDAETGKKLRAVLAAGLEGVLCVGELLAEREAGRTVDVVKRQLGAGLDGLDARALARVSVAYEPVWAIGTGKNATPADAAAVHREIRTFLADRGRAQARVLYGGSVNLKNIAALLAEPELDGVLVGGASLDPAAWSELVQTAAA